jgi:CRISPR-associated protein Cas2
MSSIVVIHTQNVPDALRGIIGNILTEVSTGIFCGKINARTRRHLWETVNSLVDPTKSSVIMIFETTNEAGISFVSIGTERRVPILKDGVLLSLFKPPSSP